VRLDLTFRQLGWREGGYELNMISRRVQQAWKSAGEKSRRETVTESNSESYKVDNLEARVALDGEWNAKDGNL